MVMHIISRLSTRGITQPEDSVQVKQSEKSLTNGQFCKCIASCIVLGTDLGLHRFRELVEGPSS